SGGQQQRVAIAMALAGEPEMLVLDEPTTGLDVTTQAHLLDLLRAIITESGTAMIYISHDLGVIARVSDRVAVMYAGELIEDAAATDLFRAPAHPYTRGLLKSMPRLALAEIPRAMAGEPPIPGSLPGCAFAPRCSFATDLCHETPPTLATIPQSAQVVRCHHFVRCHHWETVLATDFSQELHEAFQAVARHGKAEIAIELTDVAITYHRLGLLARLRGIPSPPATVSNINLSVRRGETMALVGESGSGKSTIVRMLAGLLPAKDGTIVFEDFDLTADVGARPLTLQRRIQMIFQNPDASLNPRQSVREILDQPLKLYFPEMSAADRLTRQHYLLQRVRLSERYLSRFPGQLSGGEKQRVAIGRAL
ncbi:MAG: ABC transporter ATP-binding protein, partial [Caldilineaceae bacterium]|nr:ABC transporter ATP-binding protein [Caldilineaceae bacterium]